MSTSNGSGWRVAVSGLLAAVKGNKMRRRTWVERAWIFLIALSLVAASGAAGAKKKSTLRLQSKSFDSGKMIPGKYTCQGDNISPELNWTGAPAKTKCFALIVEDPDAPEMNFTHWVIFNIPNKKGDPMADTYELVENFPRAEETREGILQGLNDFKKIGYDGPCPPSGIHRYYFQLYALDSFLPLKAGALKSQVKEAMKGHVLDQWQIMGLYGR